MKKNLISSLSLVPAAHAAFNLGVNRPGNIKITNVGTMIQSALSIVMLIAGILVFAYLIWGGIEWLTSGGDKQKTEDAKKRITSALTGLAIIGASWAIMLLIGNFFGLDTLFTEGGEGIELPTAID